MSGRGNNFQLHCELRMKKTSCMALNLLFKSLTFSSMFFDDFITRWIDTDEGCTKRLSLSDNQ